MEGHRIVDNTGGMGKRQQDFGGLCWNWLNYPIPAKNGGLHDIGLGPGPNVVDELSC